MFVSFRFSAFSRCYRSLFVVAFLIVSVSFPFFLSLFPRLSSALIFLFLEFCREKLEKTGTHIYVPIGYFQLSMSNDLVLLHTGMHLDFE